MMNMRGIYPYYVVFCLMIASACSFLDRLALSMMIEPVKAELALTDTEVRVSTCQEHSAPRIKFLANCTPSYLNYEGKRTTEFELNSPFGGGPLLYFEYLERMSREGFTDGLEFREIAEN